LKILRNVETYDVYGPYSFNLLMLYWRLDWPSM